MGILIRDSETGDQTIATQNEEAGIKKILSSRGGATPNDHTSVAAIDPGMKLPNYGNTAISKAGAATKVANIGQSLKDAARASQVSNPQPKLWRRGK